MTTTEMTDYQQEIKDLTVTRSLRLLRDGFKSDFATSVFADERTTELFAQLASEFVESNIPVIDEDNQMELAMMLLESLEVIAR
jgi:plasmid rolling circle replication initiator protein Rep